MDSIYSPKEIEAEWYQYWLDNKLFHSEPDSRESFTIVIPPPNVTGVLHMGHVLNETIQDVLVRRARQEGKNVCWVPGTDHASIATEAKVIKRLKEQGINKQDLTREQFLRHAWDWTDEHGGIILKQLRTLGCSCDWDRTAFTMDEKRSRAVIRVFCDLYRKGLIYRGLRMVNWDPERQTALSDEEVIYKDEHSHLFYLKYYVVEQAEVKPTGLDGEILRKDEKGYYALVATTRPETIMGDVAVFINPKDPANRWLSGKHVVVPRVGRIVPVMEDRYVEIGFGTGCLKVTPAHDVNDYNLGQTYNLPIIDIFTPDAHINMDTVEQELREPLLKYHGMTREQCRKAIVDDLGAQGLVEKIEDYENKVGYSERTNVPIEPRLSLQWFIRMKHFADIALPPVINDEIVFYPAKYKNTYRNWLENVKDWCISRQLWWGHRIPAYYIKSVLEEKGAEDYPDDLIFIAPTIEDAVALAKEHNAALTADDLVQDEGALDTWFSSWLWPISLFDGIEHPDNKEIQYYYPTSDLVTGPDIIFFWVARMIMAGYEYMGKMPFKNVYFTGIVRDKLGRKMSKSLGNSPDPLDLIDRYGADGVRMGILLSAPAGNDILYDDALCEQGRNFCNKIWNCFRLVKGWEVSDNLATPDVSRLAMRWFNEVLKNAAETVADQLSKYRLSDALMTIYKLYTDEFSSWYLEMIKPQYQKPIDRSTYEHTLYFFDIMLRLLHPFMPFITEELWHNITERKAGETIMTAPITVSLGLCPDSQRSTLSFGTAETGVTEKVDHIKEVVAAVRNIRAQKNIPPKQELELFVLAGKERDSAACDVESQAMLTKLAFLSAVSVANEKPQGAASFIVGTTEYAVPLEQFIDKEEQRRKLEAELQHQQGFLRSVMAKLQNERFVQNAKPEIVELERKKRADAEARIAALEESLKML